MFAIQTLLPESLDDYVSDTNPVRVVDVFVDEHDLVNLGFEGAIPADTGRPGPEADFLQSIVLIDITQNFPLLRPGHALCCAREQRPGLLSELEPLIAGDQAFALHVVSRPQQSVVPVLSVDAAFGQSKELSPGCNGQLSLRFLHHAAHSLCGG